MHKEFSGGQQLSYNICVSSVILDIAKIAFQNDCANLYCYKKLPRAFFAPDSYE